MVRAELNDSAPDFIRESIDVHGMKKNGTPELRKRLRTNYIQGIDVRDSDLEIQQIFNYKRDNFHLH